MSNLRSAEIITKSLLARRTRFGPNKVLTGVSCFFSVPTSCITVCRLQQGFLVSRVQGLHLQEKVTLGVAEERLGKRSKGRCTKFWPNLSSTFSSLPLPRARTALNPPFLTSQGNQARTQPQGVDVPPRSFLSSDLVQSIFLPGPSGAPAARGQLPRATLRRC